MSYETSYITALANKNNTNKSSKAIPGKYLYRHRQASLGRKNKRSSRFVTRDNNRQPRPRVYDKRLGTTPFSPLHAFGLGSSLGGDGHGVLEAFDNGDDIDDLVGLHRFHFVQLHERVPEESEASKREGESRRDQQTTWTPSSIDTNDQVNGVPSARRLPLSTLHSPVSAQNGDKQLGDDTRRTPACSKAN